MQHVFKYIEIYLLRFRVIFDICLIIVGIKLFKKLLEQFLLLQNSSRRGTRCKCLLLCYIEVPKPFTLINTFTSEEGTDVAEMKERLRLSYLTTSLTHIWQCSFRDGTHVTHCLPNQNTHCSMSRLFCHRHT